MLIFNTNLEGAYFNTYEFTSAQNYHLTSLSFNQSEGNSFSDCLIVYQLCKASHYQQSYLNKNLDNNLQEIIKLDDSIIILQLLEIGLNMNFENDNEERMNLIH